MRNRNFGLLLGLAIILVGSSAWAAGQQQNPTLQKAIALHDRGKVQEAIPLYQSVVKSSHNTADVLDARYGIAGCLFTLKEYDQAKDAFLAIARDYPKDPQGTLSLVQAANCLADVGKLPEAESLFDKALATKASKAGKAVWWGWANLGKGRVLMNQQKYAAAMPYLKQALLHSSETEVSADAGPLMLHCMDALKKAGKPVDQTLKARVDFEIGWYTVGQDNFGRCDAVKALRYLSRAVNETKDPTILVPAYITIGEVYLNSLSLLEDAMDAFNKVTAIHGNSPVYKASHPRWMLDNAFDLAQVWSLEARPDKVTQVCNAVLPKYSDGPADSVARVRMTKALALQLQGRSGEAAGLLRAELASNPPSNVTGDAVLTLAGILQSQGADREAAGQYVHYLSLPTTPASMIGIVALRAGLCYRSLGDTANARQYFQQAANSKDPEFATQAKQILQLLSAPQTELSAKPGKPADAPADLKAGQDAFEKGNYAEAVQRLSRAVGETTDPDILAPGYASLGKAYSELALFSDAVAAFAKVATIPADSEVNKANWAKWALEAAYGRGNILASWFSRPDEAIRVCDEALARYGTGPADGVAQVMLSQAWPLQTQGKLAQAATVLTSVEGSKASDKLKGRAAFSMGRILQSQGRFKQAIGQYLDYLRWSGAADIDRATAEFYTARCYRRLGDAANARKYFELAASSKSPVWSSRASKVLQLMAAGA